MPTYEFNEGSNLTLDGAVNTVQVLAGKVLIVDRSAVVHNPETDEVEGEETTQVLNTDESYDAQGHAAIDIHDLHGSRVYVEYTLSPTGPTPRDVNTIVIGADNQPDRSTPASQRGDTDADSETGGTGPYEDRTVPELRATAAKKGVDLGDATKKADIIEKLRGE